MDVYEFEYTANEICCTFDLLMDSLESELVADEKMSKEGAKTAARYILNRFKSTYMPALRLIQRSLFDLVDHAKEAEEVQNAKAQEDRSAETA